MVENTVFEFSYFHAKIFLRKLFCDQNFENDKTEKSKMNFRALKIRIFDWEVDRLWFSMVLRRLETVTELLVA